MKAAIHPAYNDYPRHVRVRHSFATRSTPTRATSTRKSALTCHPFFIGKQKMLDTAGRVERFRRK